MIIPAHLVPRQNDTFLTLGVELATIIHAEERRTYDALMEHYESTSSDSTSTTNIIKKSMHSHIYVDAVVNLLDKLCLPLSFTMKERLKYLKMLVMNDISAREMERMTV